MSKTLLFFLLTIAVCSQCFAQNDDLVSYLSVHQVVVNRNKDSSLILSQPVENMLNIAMRGKTLFVSGEGGSHFLYLNGDLYLMYLEYLAQRGLKYSFEEGARAWAIQDNFFLQHPEVTAANYYHIDKKHYIDLYDQKRKIYNTNHYQIIGIDFERPKDFHDEVVKIMQRQSSQTIAALHTVAPYLEDTSYIHDDSKTFKHYYKHIQDKFFEDSTRIRPLLGADYNRIAYLIGNPNINTPFGERNRPMAENLLNSIDTEDANSVYYLDCGMAHSRPNIKGSLVNILSKSNLLKDKIVVANLLCDSCITAVEPVSNWALSFAKGQIMQDFRTAAKGDIVMFDLSALPEQYGYIKAYGDLLVFARHQH